MCMMSLDSAPLVYLGGNRHKHNGSPLPDVYLTDTLLTLESKNNYMYERINTEEAGVWWALRRVVLWRASLKPLSVLRIKGKLRKSCQFIARS